MSVLYQKRFWPSTPIPSSVAHHSGDDCDDCDDEDCSCHVCLFPVVVSYECIISSRPSKVNPNRHSKYYFGKVVVTYCHVRTYVAAGSLPSLRAPMDRVGFFNLTYCPVPWGLYRGVVQTK
jgi:hypothetical protein